MISQCSACRVDSAGNHEWNCPARPKSGAVYIGFGEDQILAAARERIAALERERDEIQIALTEAMRRADYAEEDLRAVVETARYIPELIDRVQIYGPHDRLREDARKLREALDRLRVRAIVERQS